MELGGRIGPYGMYIPTEMHLDSESDSEPVPKPTRGTDGSTRLLLPSAS
jgi:hypothetical protein